MEEYCPEWVYKKKLWAGLILLVIGLLWLLKEYGYLSFNLLNFFAWIVFLLGLLMLLKAFALKSEMKPAKKGRRK